MTTYRSNENWFNLPSGCYCGVAIKEKAARKLQMTREEAIKICQGIKTEADIWKEDEVSEALSMAIEALNMAIEAPKGRPKGEWLESREQNILMAKRIEKGETWRVCSNCGTGYMIGAQYEGQKSYGKRFHNFCPRCGADMRGE